MAFNYGGFVCCLNDLFTEKQLQAASSVGARLFVALTILGSIRCVEASFVCLITHSAKLF